MVELLAAITPTAVLAVAAIFLSIASALHALLHKREPRAALGWIVFCIAIPILGAVAYYLFGVNRVSTTARRLRGTLDSGVEFSAHGVEIGNHGRISGNAVESLIGGKAAYPAMLDAIAKASVSVQLSQYIFEPSGIGAEFVDALGSAAHRGAEVHVLVDGVGDLYAWGSVVRRLRKRGVAVAKFLPLRLFPPALHLNLRNHRKLLIVDGAIAYVGGMNIRNACVATNTSERRLTKDINFAFRGPVVAEIESVFRDDWHFVTGKSLLVSVSSPTKVGDADCRVTIDGPDNATDDLSLRIQAVIGLAKRRVRLQTPYFLPTREIIGVLQTAASRGVGVEVVLPARNNLPYVHWATKNMPWELLQHGVRIFYQAGPFDHSKLLVVDDNYSFVSSANIDARSLRLNFEIGIDVWSSTLATDMNQYFDKLIEGSSEYTLEQALGRPLVERIRDAAAWLMSPYL